MILTEAQAYEVIATAYRRLLTYAFTRDILTRVDRVEFLRRSMAIARQESKFNTDAKNPSSTATGLFQVIKKTRGWMEQKLGLKKKNQAALFDANYAAIIGMTYFAYQVGRYTTWDQAVIAYNLGSFKEGTGSVYLAEHVKNYGEIYFASLENNNPVIDNLFPPNSRFLFQQDGYF